MANRETKNICFLTENVTLTPPVAVDVFQPAFISLLLFLKTEKMNIERLAQCFFEFANWKQVGTLMIKMMILESSSGWWLTYPSEK